MTTLPLFNDRVWNTKLDSKQLLFGIALAFGGIAFLLSELMYYLFVRGLGRHSERMVAEGISAFLVGLLASKLLSRTIEHRRATAVRLQVIGEMNHHIRNALDIISLSTYTIQDKQSITVISEAVDRIEWALCEILPRDVPLSEEERQRLLFLEWGKRHG
jgi:uncharacterized membrane protein